MQFLLMYRSLTYAQRSVRTLERAGITGTLTRVPKTVSRRGCGYGIIVAPRNRSRALTLLEAVGLSPERVLVRENGTYREAEHDLS